MSALACPSCGRPSAEDAAFCAGCGAKLGPTSSAREVRKTVTALFCDLVGSTTLGEQHDPEVLRPLLAAYFAEMRAAVERHGGRVEKFIGDAVSAVFGLPQAHEDDALRAVRAGVEMQERLGRLAAGTDIPLAARVGITTGEVLVPGGGAPLIGDAMNTASRLQSGAQPGWVVVGEPTWRLVREAVAVEALPPLEARGKAAPVPAWRVLAVASSSPARARRSATRMVGRAREAAALRSAFERAAADRSSQLFTVLGVAGAGKSRLVDEFLATLEPGEAEVLRGRCLSYGEGITWLPLAEALRPALGLEEFAAEADVLAAVAHAVEGEERAGEVASGLAPLFAAGRPAPAEETSRAVRRLLEVRARDRTVVLVLDDLQWAEPPLLDLVEHVAGWARDASVLLLCMARPELLDVRPGWGGGMPNAAAASLAPLGQAEVAELAAGVLGGGELPAVALSLIGRVAGGNPLFAEELAASLVEHGRLVWGADGWRVEGDLEASGVPPTVSALLSSRLDRLDEAQRRAVEAAAVEGQVFHRGAAAALLGAEAAAMLDDSLRALVRRDLVVPERSAILGEDAYRFRHLLIRDAAYDAIPKAGRAAMHVAFAGWLESAAGGRVAEQQEVLAYHLDAAVRYREELRLPEDRDIRRRAGMALAHAGITAWERAPALAAIGTLARAADLLEGDPAELPVLTALGQAHGAERHWDEAITAFEALEDAGRRHGSRAHELRGRVGSTAFRGVVDPSAHDPATDLALGQEALEAYRREGALDLVPHGVFFVADARESTGAFDDSAAGFEEAMRLADQRGDRARAGFSAGRVLYAMIHGSAPLSAAAARASQIADGAQGWFARLNGLGYRAETLALAGEGAAALAQQAAAEYQAAEAGDTLDPVSNALVPGLAALSDGELEDAVDWLSRSLAAVHASGHRGIVGVPGTPLARALLELGRDAEAAVIVEEMSGLAVWPRERVESATLGALLAARRGELDEALRLSAEAESAVAGTDLLTDRAYVALDRAEILLAAGRVDDARDTAQAALEMFERKGFAAGIRQSRAFLDRTRAPDTGDNPTGN